MCLHKQWLKHQRATVFFPIFLIYVFMQFVYLVRNTIIYWNLSRCLNKLYLFLYQSYITLTFTLCFLFLKKRLLSHNYSSVYYFLDLTESSIPRWLFEIGGIYLHGYDKEGNKLCKYIYMLACQDFAMYLSQQN